MPTRSRPPRIRRAVGIYDLDVDDLDTPEFFAMVRETVARDAPAGIPPKAAFEIQKAIQLYRIFKANEGLPRPAEVRKSLQIGRRKARDLLAWLKDLDDRTRETVRMVASGDAYDPQTEPDLVQLGPIRFGNALDRLERLCAWLDQSVRVPKGSPGQPELAALTWFVRQLAGIWHRETGRPFSRTGIGSVTPTDFVTSVCAHADPHVTTAQIGTAIKRVVADIRRGKNSSQP